MTIGDLLIQYSNQIFPSLVDLLLKIAGALIILIFGWFIAWVLDYIIRWVVSKLKINDFLRKVGIGKYFERANIVLQVEQALGFVVFWSVFGLFLMAAFDTLGLSSVNFFIRQIINYLPTALAGALILAIAIFIGEFVKKLISISLKRSGIKSIDAIANFAKWAIVVFGTLIALSQWGLAQDVINILITGLVAFLALAGGLAFGLGGQETAKEILEHLKKELKEK